MKYTDEEIKKAYAIIESANSDSQLKAQVSASPEFVIIFFQQLKELSPFEHMDIFLMLKQFTGERLITDVKAFERDYMELKEKVNHIDEFLKTKIS